MAFIDGTVVNVALPALQKQFGAGIQEAQWVVESYALLLTSLLLLGGSMGDRFGRRRIFALGVALFGAALVPFILIMFALSRWAGGLVDRYGARGPLVIGPAIAASGFALLAVPGIGGSYWTTFFPAILVLGLGMTITIAPLTTTVMNALNPAHAGAASGVNNAVSRAAGLLAIALLGIVMSQAFNHEMARRSRDLPVSNQTLVQLDLQRNRLAAIAPPLSATEDERKAIKTVVGGSFVYGFRCVMLISALLAVVSSLSAWFMVDRIGEGRE